MADVIVIGADKQFAPDAKSVFVNCRIEGGFKGDFALMVPPGYDGEEFKGRGICVHQVPDDGYYIKMHVFDECFRRWDRVLALDCDVQVQGPLSKVFEVLGKPIFDSLPSRRCVSNVIYAKRRMNLLEYFHLLDPTPEDHLETYAWLGANCSWYEWSVFDPSMMIFRPSAIPQGIAERIQEVKAIVAPANPLQYDVHVLNVVLGVLVHRIGETAALYADHEAGLAHDIGPESPFDYVGNETSNTVLFHFGRHHNPRFEKQPGAEGHCTQRCQTPCHDIYQRNLEKFDKVFPVV